MKRIFAARHSSEAHFVKGLLETEGIQAEVRGEDLSFIRGGVPVTPDTSPSVWVLDDTQIESARAVIKRYEAGEHGQPATPSPWRCPACGEEVEGQFTSCWNCGTDQPAT